MESLTELFSERLFMPHGHCYLWTPALVWLQVLTNMIIGLSYVVISASLALLIVRVRDLPFKPIYAAFGVFIVSCGFTHFMDVWVIWSPRYWLDGGVRVITALASVGTAAVLPLFLPQAVRLVKGVQRMRRQGVALEAAMNDLSTMYSRARELDQLKSTFFANVSHELRTPLTLILAPIEELLGSTHLSPDERDSLRVVQRNAHSLLAHVNNLLDLDKLDAGKLEPDYRDTDLVELVRSAAANFDSVARERCMRFEVSAPAELSAQVDPDKIRRVLLNLLSNAFKFTPAGGAIVVELTRAPHAPGQQPERALLAVRDSGPGVATVQREHIFERFGQASTPDSRPVGGTGLGLSIVREFARLHRGDVSVGTAPEGGAWFEVSLPLQAPDGAVLRGSGPDPEFGLSLAVAHLAPSSQRASTPGARLPHAALPPAPGEQRTAAAGGAELRTPASAPPPAARASTPGALPQRPASVPPQAETQPPADDESRPLILVVEDNPDMRALLVRTLHSRYRVVSAEDGELGLAKARELAPDLIISDMMMPKLGGEELVSAVRMNAELDPIPILLLSAKTDHGLRARVLERGAQDYLLKPFSRDELMARVKNMIIIKRTHDLLQSAADAKQQDVELLSREVVLRKRELELALADAREARHHAERASGAKSDFLSLVSHELRTPIASIELQLDRLRRGVAGALGEQQVEILARVRRSAARLRDLVESLLEFARIESGRVDVRRSQIDLIKEMREIVEELKPRAESKSILLEFASEVASLEIETDPNLLRLIAVNLVDNAIKYTDTGRIDVRVEQSSRGTLLRVVDTGRGIDAAHQERIFQPFEQLDDVRSKGGPGVGLGLTLVRNIARVLNAEIALESARGHGSTFTVTLAHQ
jgi:signal transduction histidine kinase